MARTNRKVNFMDTATGGWLARDSTNTSETPAQGWLFPPWGYAYAGRMNMGLGGLGDSPIVADLKQAAADMPWWGWAGLAVLIWKKVL